MKYCKKCGMLLEDTQDICIGCGLDVSLPENTSEFPPELAEQMENKKEQEKKKTGIIIAIIAVFVLLAILIGIIVVYTSKNTKIEEPVAEEPIAEAEAEEEEAPQEDSDTEEEAVAEEPPAVQDDREVSDTEGDYYKIGKVYDEAGNLMFTTLYPEDFGDLESNFAYDKYSDLFPMVMTAVTTNSDNTLRLTFTSPQHFWYQDSSKGQTRDNEVDLDYYMSYFKYSGPQGFVEAMIGQAYPGAKKVELTETKEAPESVIETLNLLIKEKTKKLTGDIGDYAHIGETTTYATGESESTANIFKYHIVTAEGEDVYSDFYVPIIANSFYYANDMTGDQGSVTEWMPLCVISYESGNIETYEFYEDVFTVFVNNSILTKEFFRINEEYGKIIDQAVENKTEAEAVTPDLLKKLTEAVTANNKLNDMNSDIYDFLRTPDEALPTFSDTEHRVTGIENTMQAFYSESEGKVYITPSETEYPGSEYKDLLQ
ncbi:MAG: hypothetical protein K6B28_11885 [Lachnospiraceae bacterium]|nr:hypothetical protein [Lachnospiraceae bacterium]